MGTSQRWLEHVLQSHIGRDGFQFRQFYALLLRDTGSGPIVDDPADATLADVFARPTNREASALGYERQRLISLWTTLDPVRNQAQVVAGPVTFDDMMPGEAYVGVVIFEEGEDDASRYKVAMKPINPPQSNVASITIRFGGAEGSDSGAFYYNDATEEPEVIAPAHNLLVNGGHVVSQNGTAWTSVTTIPNNDGTYLCDQWILLSDGNDVVDVSKVSDVVPLGVARSMLFDVETADLKFGMLQILESLRTPYLRGKTISLRAKVRRSGASLGHFKIALLSWIGGVPVRDVVATWNGSGVTPTFVAGWSVIAQAELIPSVTGAFETLKLEGVSVPESPTNLAFFIWCDDASTVVGETVHIAETRMNIGERCDDWVEKPFSQELMDCYYFFIKTFNVSTVPAQSAGVEGALACVGGPTAGKLAFEWRFPVNMRQLASGPIITTFNPSAANASARNITDSTDTAVAPVSTNVNAAVTFIATVDDATDAGDLMRLHATIDARF